MLHCRNVRFASGESAGLELLNHNDGVCEASVRQIKNSLSTFDNSCWTSYFYDYGLVYMLGSLVTLIFHSVHLIIDENYQVHLGS